MLRRKFFTAVSLFGISFTLLVLLIVTAFIENEIGPRTPDVKIDRTLYVVTAQTGNDDEESYNINLPTFYFGTKYIKSLTTPENVSLYSWRNGTTEYVNDKKINIHYRYTDAEFWEIFEFNFINGKPFTRVDLEKSAPVAVINEDIAQQYFGSDNPVGKYMDLNRETYRIIGVVENIPYRQWSRGPGSMIWLPYTSIKQDYKKPELRPSFAPGFNAVILANHRSDLSKIKDELQQKVNNIDFADPTHISWLEVLPLTRKEMLAFASNFFFEGNEMNRDNPPHASVARFYLWVSLIALLFMSMPAINLMNLNSSRIIERSSEIGVRKAFGASSNTLVGQFITENIIVTLVGAAVGYALAYFVLDALNDSGFITYSTLSINTKVFVYGLLISIFFGFLSGVYPAFRMSRLHPATALKEGHS